MASNSLTSRNVEGAPEITTIHSKLEDVEEKIRPTSSGTDAEAMVFPMESGMYRHLSHTSKRRHFDDPLL